jgi:hypothetical protein
MGGTVNRNTARRARVIALRVLAYRAWSDDPAAGEIPSIDILSDPRLHRRERERELRRAQNGTFAAPVRHREPGLRRVA